MAGQRAQIAVPGDELGAAGQLGRRDRHAPPAGLARQEFVDRLLTFLRLERAGAIDENAARPGQGGGACDEPALQRGERGDDRTAA